MVFVGIKKAINPDELFNVKAFNVFMAFIASLIAIDIISIKFFGTYLIKDGLMYGLIILLILIFKYFLHFKKLQVLLVNP